MSSSCYYALLGVPRTASLDQIKRGYRKAALRWHPDKNRDADASEKFKLVAEAFSVLSDPSLRAEYDAGGEPAVRAAESGGGGGYAPSASSAAAPGRRYYADHAAAAHAHQCTCPAALVTALRPDWLLRGVVVSSARRSARLPMAVHVWRQLSFRRPLY